LSAFYKKGAGKVKKYTLKEWQDEGERLFGNSPENWRFVCPACGRESTGREFKEAGADAEVMYKTCIGRHNGKGGKPLKSKTTPDVCDWAAFGLLGTLCKGNIVILDSGKEVEVFAFGGAVA
jgi:hypothetical protein